MAKDRRSDLFNYDPITELRIIGGKSLPANEQGDHDTEIDEENPMHDARLSKPLKSEFIANVNALGVTTPIIVTKIDGVPHVVAGRRRVRAARVANRERVARGEPPMRVDAKVIRPTSDLRLMAVMIAENENREDDDYATKVYKLKDYMERGVELEDASIVFGIKPTVAKAWLAFEDNAIAPVVAAVHRGEITVTAGMEIARAKTPEAQATAFSALKETAHVNGGKVSSRKARELTKRAVKPEAQTGCSSRSEQKKLLQAIQDRAHASNTSEKTLAFWEGAENMLMLLLGDEEADRRLVDMLDAVRKARSKS